MKEICRKFIPKMFLNFYYIFWSFLGALIYRFPSKDIKVIGITGTKGKTTVTHLTCDILEEAGYRVGSISSLRFKAGDKEWKNELKMTMPGRMIIQKMLRQTVDYGCEYFVLEVTSEGIKQQRHRFIDFDVAVFTNLAPEHIESHGSFEKYKEAKGELFRIAKNAVINLDDENAEYFAELCGGEKYYYKLKSQSANWRTNLKTTSQMSKVLIGDDMKMNLSLLGEFNIYNALAAACVGISQRIDLAVIKRALEKSKGIPGRMEVIVRDPFTVIVDYAHTPDSLKKVYTTRQNTKLICVLGSAGGGRDKWKRPEMGKIAAHYCDEIILTNEDPYEENPSQILSDIKNGISSIQYPVSRLHEILDRRQAIREALRIAKSGDTVIITGKGAEPWMMVRGGKIPWDDREVVREEFKKLSVG